MILRCSYGNNIVLRYTPTVSHLSLSSVRHLRQSDIYVIWSGRSFSAGCWWDRSRFMKAICCHLFIEWIHCVRPPHSWRLPAKNDEMASCGDAYTLLARLIMCECVGVLSKCKYGRVLNNVSTAIALAASFTTAKITYWQRRGSYQNLIARRKLIYAGSHRWRSSAARCTSYHSPFLVKCAFTEARNHYVIDGKYEQFHFACAFIDLHKMRYDLGTKSQEMLQITKNADFKTIAIMSFACSVSFVAKYFSQYFSLL